MVLFNVIKSLTFNKLENGTLYIDTLSTDQLVVILEVQDAYFIDIFYKGADVKVAGNKTTLTGSQEDINLSLN